MKNKLGTFFMILGALLILAALALLLYNHHETAKAQAASAQVIHELLEKLEEEALPTLPAQMPPEQVPIPTLPSKQMKEIEIDGRMYIGHLTIPSLSLELPVLSDWDYEKLRVAPCRYYGTVNGNDFVIMAHNYASHFGAIGNLKAGDAVYFTDADGITTTYGVVAVDVLDPYAVDDVIAGDFDLTLFTCTYGGQTRICVYCDRS